MGGTNADEDCIKIFENEYNFLKVRTKSKDCTKVVPEAFQMKCYYLEYNAGTLDNETLSDGSESWMYFHTAEENNVTSQVKYISKKKLNFLKIF